MRPKSPQEKKKLEYERDHFTFGWHSSRMFPKTWKRKKTYANREYRRKSAEVLTPAKPGMTSDEMELIIDDLTAGRFQKSVSRKRLHKTGTVALGEKIRRKIKRRQQSQNRRNKTNHLWDARAARAVELLSSLTGSEFVGAVRRASVVCNGNADELRRVLRSKAPLENALHFLYELSIGSAFAIEALKRNPELGVTLGKWMAKANRTLERDRQTEALKGKEREAVRKKLRAQSRQ